MNDNSFSWARTRLVARYYYPNLRWQVIAYPAAGLAIGLLNYLLYSTEWGFLVAALVSIISGALVYFGPLIFIRRSNRVVETMLPATGAEKSTFLIPYCIIFLPLCVYGLSAAVYYTLSALFGEPAFMEQFSQMTMNMLHNAVYAVFQTCQSLVGPATCMFCVFALRRNRMMAIFWTILSSVGLGIIGAIFGFVWAFRNDISSTIVESGPDAIAENLVTTMLEPMVLVLGFVCLIYVGIMVWLTYRKISRIQL